MGGGRGAELASDENAERFLMLMSPAAFFAIAAAHQGFFLSLRVWLVLEMNF